jgi:predicted  nucleic acid-binding Zn-ribbon protein
MPHECEWLSDCCGAEPMEGAVCSQCRDTSGFSCEGHTPLDDTETCPECGRILKDSKSRCFNCTASDYIEGEVKA